LNDPANDTSDEKKVVKRRRDLEKNKALVAKWDGWIAAVEKAIAQEEETDE